MYYDPVNDTTSPWIDVTANDGKFCPNIYYKEWSSCPSGYMATVLLGYRVTNLETGQTAGTSGVSHSFYLECTDVVPNPELRAPSDYALDENPHIDKETVIEKDRDGRIISVRSIYDEIRK